MYICTYSINIYIIPYNKITYTNIINHAIKSIYNFRLLSFECMVIFYRQTVSLIKFKKKPRINNNVKIILVWNKNLYFSLKPVMWKPAVSGNVESWTL